MTHQVYEPRNTLHASRFNSTDGWGWEASLWFSMGEDIREGSWAPQSDPVPSDILEMIAYANTKGVKLLACKFHCLEAAVFVLRCQGNTRIQQVF